MGSDLGTRFLPRGIKYMNHLTFLRVLKLFASMMACSIPANTINDINATIVTSNTSVTSVVELPSIHGVMDLSVVICTYMDLCSAIYLIR